MSKKTIFIALAAYCEPELDLTIQDCLTKAAHPERLRFGICLQFDPEGVPEIQENCIDHFLDDYRFQVLKFDYRDSKGGCWARNLVQGLYAQEDFTLQVDAHTRFIEHWDLILIEMLKKFPGSKPLITNFPPLYFIREGKEIFQALDWDAYINTTFVQSWEKGGWINHPTKAIADNAFSPRYTRFLSGAFVFTTGEWNHVVRQDPEHYFWGEEFALTLRSYTHGYDLFTPDKVVVWHRCHPEPNRKHFSDFGKVVRKKHNDVAFSRLRTLLAGDPDKQLGPYSLGNERNLEDFYIFSGLNCKTYEAHPDAYAGVPPNPTTL